MVPQMLPSVEEVAQSATQFSVPVPGPLPPLPFDAAVIRPFGSTVMVAFVYVPTLELTVARVPAQDPALVVKSPVNAGKFAHGRVVKP